ncbi:MAG: hypothetical protein QW212_04900 [Nitrososphaerales archaeon]
MSEDLVCDEFGRWRRVIKNRPKLIYEFVSKSGERAEVDVASEQLYGGEEVLWWYSVERGVFRKRLERYWFITNLRVCRFDYEEGNVEATPLKDLDVVVTEKEHTTSSQRIGMYTGKLENIVGIVGVGTSRTKSRTIGNLLFIREGRVLVKFTKISDPDGVKKLVEVLKRNLRDVEVRPLSLA